MAPSDDATEFLDTLLALGEASEMRGALRTVSALLSVATAAETAHSHGLAHVCADELERVRRLAKEIADAAQCLNTLKRKVA